MWSELLLTVVALLVVLGKLSHKGLLNVCVVEHLLLHGEAHLDTLGGGIRVHEGSINDLDLLEPLI